MVLEEFRTGTTLVTVKAARIGRAILLCLAASVVACSGTPEVGVVDVEQAFQRSPLVMVSSVQLNEQFKSVQWNLKKRGRELAHLRQQLGYEDAQISTDARAALEARLESKTAKLLELQRQYRADLAVAQERRAEEMIARVVAVATEVARREGLPLLIKKEAIVYADNDGIVRRDITDQVIRALLERMNPTKIPAPVD